MKAAERSLLPFERMPGPSRFSMLGAVREQVRFDRDPIGHMLRLRRQYGDLVRYASRLGDMVFAFGPESNRQLHADTELFHSRPFVLPGPRQSSHDRLRKSIFSLNEDFHRRMRHQLLPAFQRTALPGYYSDVVRLVQESTGDWRAGQTRNLHRDMHLLVWGVVRKLLYGLEESQASENLHEAMEHWIFQTFSPWVRSFPYNLPLTPYRRMLRDAAGLERQFLSLMSERRQRGCSGRDALSALLRLASDDGLAVPVEQLVGHALTLFLVAYETTGNTLTWTLFLLAQHPAALHDLLDELAPWRGEPPPWERLEKLPFLDAVLKESMRLLPAVPYSRRLASRDGALGDYFLPKRTRILFSHYVTHHMPEIYPEPNAFLPERWFAIAPSPAEYLPFGAGLRTCLGVALAQFVMKITLAIVLPRWKLTVVPNTRIDRLLGISLGPKGGIAVDVAEQDRKLSAAPISGNIHEMIDFSRGQQHRRRLAA